MTTASCTEAILNETIFVLRKGGRLGQERLVLWLTHAGTLAPASISEVYEPQQETAEDYFHVPPAGMRALMSYLRLNRLKTVAQIHSHPGPAFHSEADNRWAIVRHRGALSLVLPHFASTVTAANFFQQAMIYELSSTDEWEHVSSRGGGAPIVVTQ
jgi:proteasome lid subunit RPN8/RPN11